LSTTNPTWIEPGANLGLCGERLATNCLSHVMATVSELQCWWNSVSPQWMILLVECCSLARAVLSVKFMWWLFIVCSAITVLHVPARCM
jgi:hypothetical protein